MKKKLARGLSLILAVLLLAGLLPAAAIAAGDEDSLISAEVTMGSLYGRAGKTTDTCYYSDSWFTEDSAKLNSHLATLSAMASVTPAEEGGGIAALLETFGFADIRMNGYYAEDIKLADSVGCIVGRKTIKDSKGSEATLLAVFPRSSGYETEWAGNLHVGGSGLHQGFLAARDEILRFMKQYMDSLAITGSVKVWAAGYSRGAAVINLVGGFLAEDSGYFGAGVRIAPEDVFVYTFATPMGITEGVTKKEALSVAGPGAGLPDTDTPAYTYAGADADALIQPGDSRYGGIHNFAASGDYFAKLPPAIWGFTRYGTTVDVEFGGEDMLAWLGLLNEEAAEMFAQNGGYSTPLPIKIPDLREQKLVDTEEKISTDALIAQHLNAMASLAPSREAYVSLGYADVLGALSVLLSTEGSGFARAFAQADAETLQKTALLSYLAYALEQQRKTDAAITDEAAVAEVMFELMDFLGLKVGDKAGYTAQQLLKDVLASLLKLMQDESQTITELLPAEYAPLFQDLLELAQEIQPETVDDLIELIARFAVNPKHLMLAQALLTPLTASMSVEDMALLCTMISGITNQTYDASAEGTKTALIDLVKGCAQGSGEKDAASFRASVRQLLSLTFRKQLSGQTALTALLKDSADAPSAPVSFETLVKELVLADLLEKDESGSPMTLTASADAALADLLSLGGADDAYVEMLTANPGAIRAVVTAFIFAPQGDYSLLRDVVNAANFADRLQYLLPAHFPDLYISWLKTLDDNYVLPDKGRDEGGAPEWQPEEAPAQPACSKGDSCPLLTFTDLDPAAWYHDGIEFVLEKGVMQGYGDGTFGPEDSITRAMMAQILWNLEGNPEVGFPLDYTDVTDANWFAPAVRWATGAGILQGYGNGKFGPKDTLTREQLITIVYRYAKLKAGAAAPDGDIPGYADASEVSSWAAEAFRWAVQEQLLAGEAKLSPREDATRALIATIIMRYFTGAEG